MKKRKSHEKEHQRLSQKTEKESHGIARSDEKDEKDKKIDELTERLQRLQADFENSKKRLEKEKMQYKTYVESDFLKRFLALADTFNNAMVHAKNNEKEIIKPIADQFFSILKNFGVTAFESKGRIFDPQFHEAMMTEEGKNDKEIVTEEFQKGYMYNGSILRHSKVKVSKPKKHDAPQPR